MIADFLTGGTIDKINLQAAGFAGLTLGGLRVNQYCEGTTLQLASRAAFTANSNRSGKAILAVTSGGQSTGIL